MKSAVLPRNVRLSILLVQLVTIATLMRSVAFDRWITILASLVLLIGAAAAKRNREAADAYRSALARTPGRTVTADGLKNVTQ